MNLSTSPIPPSDSFLFVYLHSFFIIRIIILMFAFTAKFKTNKQTNKKKIEIN